jgi:arylsulfatase A-like enzyme
LVLESFRADAVGRIVNGKAVTPVLDSLAREGVASPVAFSHNGYTTQSRFHLFTGSLAGKRRDGSLVDDFKANGYQTAYFSAQDESFGGSALGVGFDRAEVAYDARQDRERRYSTSTTAGSLAVSHATLQERIATFLRTRDRSRPLFLYVNFHDTHFPYHHDDIAPLVSSQVLRRAQIRPSRKDDVQEMYFNAAANVDRALGSTLEAVRRALGSDPAVVVTADHGESLFDQNFLGHGYALNDVQTRIPLIARGLPLEIVEPFGQVDLRNAIVEALSDARSDNVGPRAFARADKVVFQYLGHVDRPRQIAFLSGAGRMIYDFRDERVLLPDGTTASPASLSGEPAAQFLRLVHFWERMMLARTAAGAPRDE